MNFFHDFSMHAEGINISRLQCRNRVGWLLWSRSPIIVTSESIVTHYSLILCYVLECFGSEMIGRSDNMQVILGYLCHLPCTGARSYWRLCANNPYLNKKHLPFLNYWSPPSFKNYLFPCDKVYRELGFNGLVCVLLLLGIMGTNHRCLVKVVAMEV